MPNEIFYMIVYLRGDRTVLDVAEMQWFDVQDYDLASELEFDDEFEAQAHARRLAELHELKVKFSGSGLLDAGKETRPVKIHMTAATFEVSAANGIGVVIEMNASFAASMTPDQARALAKALYEKAHLIENRRCDNLNAEEKNEQAY